MEADQSVSVHFRGQELDGVNLMGVTTNIAVISNLQVAEGRFLVDSEDQRHVAVAFIGNDVRERFFSDRDPVGQTLVVGGKPFLVVGTAKKRGSSFGDSQDNFVVIPISTFLKNFERTRKSSLSPWP